MQPKYQSSAMGGERIGNGRDWEGRGGEREEEKGWDNEMRIGQKR